jgi:hypothetical protein
VELGSVPAQHSTQEVFQRSAGALMVGQEMFCSGSFSGMQSAICNLDTPRFHHPPFPRRQVGNQGKGAIPGTDLHGFILSVNRMAHVQFSY